MLHYYVLIVTVHILYVITFHGTLVRLCVLRMATVVSIRG